MMRTMRSSESVCSCSKPPPRQSRRSPDETSKTKKKNTTPETKRFQACNDFSPLHRFNRIKATDTKKGFRRLHRSSVFHWLHFHLTSNFFSITPLASLPSKDPPFPRPKIWRHGPILYKLKLLRFFPAVFRYIEFQILFSLHVYLAYCFLNFLLAKRF